jgi:transcriptional regulator with XRE-family HTH domain
VFTVEIDTDELRRRRRLAGLTQGQLDVKAGLKEGRVTQFERSIVRPTPEEVIAMASALQVPSDLLVTKDASRELQAAITTVGRLLRIRVNLDPENEVNTVVI